MRQNTLTSPSCLLQVLGQSYGKLINTVCNSPRWTGFKKKVVKLGHGKDKIEIRNLVLNNLCLKWLLKIQVELWITHYKMAVWYAIRELEIKTVLKTNTQIGFKPMLLRGFCLYWVFMWMVYSSNWVHPLTEFKEILTRSLKKKESCKENED